MPNILQKIGAKLFGYDAVTSTGRRRAQKVITQSEDSHLNSANRRKLIATARDLPRNFAIAAWMIRKHLDYVTRFNFQSRTGNKPLDEKIEAIIKSASTPGNCDVSGRFDLPKLLRISEARRVVDGDCFWIKLTSGHVQIIEADRVRTPSGNSQIPAGYKLDDFTHGVKTTAGGRLQSIIVCKRGKYGSDFDFEKIIPARHIWHHAYIDRIDQIRGISPLAPAINSLLDTYEGFDLAMAKAKVAQMFGLIMYRDAVDQIGDGFGTTQTETADDDSTTDEERYKVDPGKGPFKLELEPGEKAEFLSTNTPESAFQDFLRGMIDVSLKSLDIPYSFYDPSKANYYGQKADLQQYESSATDKRAGNKQLLNSWTIWTLQNAIITGRLELPAKMTLDDLIFGWASAGMFWIDKLRDLKADEIAIKANLDSTQRVALRRGEDAYEIADENLKLEKYIIEKREEMDLPPLVTPGAVPITDNAKDKSDDNA